MSNDQELRDALEDVRRNCLRGQPVPEDLAALWRAQLNDDTELLDAFEMVLLDDADEDLFSDLLEDDVEPALARAFNRMTSQVCWVAEVDGALVGYWVGEEQRPVAESPVVVCDDEGQFELGGRTMAEFLLDFAEPDDPEDFTEVRDALERLGVRVPVKNQDEIWDRLEGWHEPNGVVLGYVVEERMHG